MTVVGLSGAGSASRTLADRLAGPVLLACTVVAAGTLVALVGVLGVETGCFFTQVSLVRFFTEADWTPFAEEPRFGVLPLLAATAQIAVGAGVFGVPAGLMTAVYLEHYAGARAKRTALKSVPAPLMEAGLALGASKGRVVARVLVPAAFGGIVAAVFLALARAAGETMIVTLAAGNQAHLTWSPLEGLRTLTTFIAQSSLGDAPNGTLQYGALFAVSAVLLVVSWGLHATGRFLVSRRRWGSVR